MSWRPHGRAHVSARNPRAVGICDRCSLLYNHYDLTWQFDWAGVRLQNLRILVCRSCLDDPQQQLRAKILTPDPIPIWNARPEPFTFTGFSYQESNIMCQPTPLGSPPNTWPLMSGLVMAMPGGQTFMLMPTGSDGAPIPPPPPPSDFGINLTLDFDQPGYPLIE
jgi:hypothetical protein